MTAMRLRLLFCSAGLVTALGGPAAFADDGANGQKAPEHKITQSKSYMMVDPIGGFGDWTAFLDGLAPALPIRLAIIASGLAISLSALAFGARTIDAFNTFKPQPEQT